MHQPSRHRHEPILKIASGGMATVFLGSLEGALGFRQMVAIKRPHPHLLEDASFRASLLREARLAAGIHHANVVDVRDVEVVGDTIQLVMDYIEGASLGELVRARAEADSRLPPGVALRIVLDACAGLHAAHDATDEDGRPLGLVHRDVSPQNVLVGVDGVARVTDFGIAKCVETSEPWTSRETLKGKIGYMAPEYLRGEAVDRRADVFALGVVLWEALSGRRLFRAQTDGETLERVLSSPIPRVSEAAPDLAALDAVVAKGVARDRNARFASAAEMAEALEQVARPGGLVATHAEVGTFVRETVGPRLDERRRALRETRRDGAPSSVPPPAAPAAAAGAQPASPAEATTRAERAPASKPSRKIALALAGVVALAAAGAVTYVRSRPRPAPAAPGASVPPAVAPPPPSIDAPVLPTASVALPAVSVAPAPSKPPRPGPRATGHAPPPNPYPSRP